MDLSQLANVGEFIGGFAVIGSLLFVGFQVRSNTRTLRATTTYEAHHNLSTINRNIAAHPDLAKIIAIMESRRVGELDDIERDRMWYLVREVFQHIEGELHLLNHGILDRAIWDTHIAWTRRVAETPLGAEWWAAERQVGIFSPEFIEWVDGAHA